MNADPLRMAVGTLTAVPVPAPERLDPPVPGRAMLLAPVAGLVPGCAAGLVAWLALGLSLGEPVAAVLAVAVLALTTRGLHLDGLADTADGLAASYDRSRALAVMRTGDVGPAGAATLVLVLLLQVAALAQALGTGGATTVAVAAVTARLALPALCSRGVPAARPDGLGAAVAGTVGAVGLLLVAAICAVAAVAALAAAGATPWAGPLAVLAVLAGSAALARRCVRRLGGITGDVLGASVELGTAATLLVLAAFG